MGITYFVGFFFIVWLFNIILNANQKDIDKSIGKLNDTLEEIGDLAKEELSSKEHKIEPEEEYVDEYIKLQYDEKARLDPGSIFFEPEAYKNAKIEWMKTPKYQVQRAIIFGRDGNRCVNCGSFNNLEMHHIRYSKFGEEPDEDLQTLCRKCHQKRHDKTGYNYEDIH